MAHNHEIAGSSPAPATHELEARQVGDQVVLLHNGVEVGRLPGKLGVDVGTYLFIRQEADPIQLQEVDEWPLGWL